MNKALALEQYTEALKLGQKEYKECAAKELEPHPAVLDALLDKDTFDYSVYVGTIDIPTDRVVGTKSAGRVCAFSRSFYPLLKQDSEFAAKWIALCADHLGDTGIRDAIKCYEYMGKFYIQEGNKRFSILKYNGAPRVTGEVYRILPPKSSDPNILAYYDFLEFFRDAKLYDVQFRHRGCFAKLCDRIGIPVGQPWTEDQRRIFRSRFHSFREVFLWLGGDRLLMLPEDALLIWLQVHRYEELGEMSDAQLKRSLQDMWDNLVSISTPEKVVRTEAPSTEGKTGLHRILLPTHIHVAFVHQRACSTSDWTKAHDEGRKHLEEALGKAVTVHSYFNANTDEEAEALLEQAVAEGAQVIFTTTPQLIGPSLKVSLRHPKVRFLNCSVHMPYSTVRTYYARIFEGKFISGAIAGAVAASYGENRIGYVGTYPIFGVPASINAFALGARMTNPKAQVYLKWSCLPGNPSQELLSTGIRVISNRDNAEFGTYFQTDEGNLIPLGSPCWLWGNFYESVIRSVLAGTWDKERSGTAVNDWWGMTSGVIDVTFSKNLPQGLQQLASILRQGLKSGTVHPFQTRITAQDGSVRNDGSRNFDTEELLHMDWLCSNVIGDIPDFDQLLPISRPTVRLLGIHREDIPDIKEVSE